MVIRWRFGGDPKVRCNGMNMTSRNYVGFGGSVALRRFLMAAGAGSLLVAAIPAAMAMTLEEAVKVAVDSHPTVLADKSKQVQAGFEIDEARAPKLESATTAIRNNLNQCLEVADDGKPRLTVTLPSAEALDGLARALAVLASASGNAGPRQ